MVELLLLDTRTLAFVSGLGGFIMAATMLGLYASGTRQAGVIEWAIGGFVFGLGYLLGHLFLTLELSMPGWLVSSMANNLIGLGHVMVLLGVQSYLGLRPWRWLVAVPFVLFASVFVPALRQFPTPFLAETILLVGTYVAAGILLWRARAPGLAAYRGATAALLLVFSVFLAGRTGYYMITRAVTDSFDPNTLQALTFLTSMVFGFVLTMALVLLIFREKEMRMRDIARRDALTGLHNRFALKEASHRAYRHAQASREPLSLLAMDLDHFKAINDRYGHNGGDQVLKGVARTIIRELRMRDRVFRVGGEEFLILLPCTSLEESVRVAERLRVVIESAEWHVDDDTMTVTASFGAVEVEPEHETWDTALVRADRALYRAKHGGRNCIARGHDPVPGPTTVIAGGVQVTALAAS